jgi:hypothetical protein
VRPANFVGSALDPIDSVGTGSELFVVKRSTSGGVDDGVGA